MAVDAVSSLSSAAASAYTRNEVSGNGYDMDMEDFLTLLAAQLQYQDVSNPMSNSEMMSQLTQMATMSAMENMSNTVSKYMESMSTNVSNSMSSMAQISMSAYATNLLGQKVVVANVDENGKLLNTTTGVVEGISFYDADPKIYVDGKEYSLSQLMSVGKVEEEEDAETGTENGTDTDTDTGTSEEI